MAEKNWLQEELSRFMDVSSDRAEGVKPWMISTLGTSLAGKTVLISSLYAQYYMGFENGRVIGIEAAKGDELHDLLSGVARGLKAQPVRLPPSSTEVRSAHLKFVLRDLGSPYQKIVQLQDHPGEHLSRGSGNHSETIERLRDSDAFMIFLDSEKLIGDDLSEIAERLQLNIIKSIVRDVASRVSDDDILPISVVIAKSDITEDIPMLMDRATSLFRTLSAEIGKCLFFFVPVSVVRKIERPNGYIVSWHPYQTEAPFLFSMAGVVLRNATVLQVFASETIQRRDSVASTSIEGGFFARLAGTIIKKIEERRLDLKAKRTISLSQHDIVLAKAAYRVLEQAEHCVTMKQGVELDDIEQAIGSRMM